MEPGLVSFVGAGPGDPDLLTLKGKAAIEMADLVLYAGSLVPKPVVAWAKASAKVYDSAPMTLDETHALIRQTALSGGRTARVHTGDPSLYGALIEQIRLLDKDGIPWEVIPGVTAAMAAAASAGISFTVPEVSQTLILTRMAGATPMPPAENIRALASHGTAMAIYLSGTLAKNLQEELAVVLPSNTPVLCAKCASWPNEVLAWTTVGELSECVAQNDLMRQTVFLVLPGQNSHKVSSRLYSGDFSHMFRNRRTTI